MNNYIRKMLDIAASVALLGDLERKQRIGAIGKRLDGALVYSYNGRPSERHPPSHAEHRLSKKLDSCDTVFVARVDRSSSLLTLSKPCFNCECALRSRRVKKVIYSISEKEYGVLFL